MEIAIIEDSKLVANFFTSYLEESDYQVSLYTSKPEDIGLLAETGADLVVCPGFPTHQEGPHIISTLKAEPRFRETSVVVSTSLQAQDLQSEWDLAYVDGILLKPFTQAQILELLDEIKARRAAIDRETPLAVIVDDSITVRSVLKAEMESLGFEVMTAVNGQEGVALVLKVMPDIVLTDIEMPVKTGLELCHDLYTHPQTNHIPIIVISTLVNDGKVRDGFDYGASHFLKKPVNADELAAAINDVLGPRDVTRMGSALVAESTPTTASIIRRELRKAGVHSNLCRTVAELEAFLAVSRPDLITVDLSLPDEAGPDVCRKIRQRDDLATTPVIMIGDEKDRETIVQCLNAGANDFLTKPFTREELQARVQTHLRTKRLYDELTQRNRMLESLAYRDGLTGLLNRRYLDEALVREMIQARQSETTLGYFIIDLDHFKKVNDTYGHKIGDEILQAIASDIQNCVGQRGIACRYGGEEMCVFLPEVTLAKTKELAERVRSSVEQKRYTEHLIKQTLSVGVSAFPEPSGESSLLNDADQALYQAKATGRNRVLAFPF